MKLEPLRCMDRRTTSVRPDRFMDPPTPSVDGEPEREDEASGPGALTRDDPRVAGHHRGRESGALSTRRAAVQRTAPAARVTPAIASMGRGSCFNRRALTTTKIKEALATRWIGTIRFTKRLIRSAIRYRSGDSVGAAGSPRGWYGGESPFMNCACAYNTTW